MLSRSEYWLEKPLSSILQVSNTHLPFHLTSPNFKDEKLYKNT
jgi:hypothetical protein